MNIFSKVTLQSLKKNRTRTVVTVIGVILSAAMICAVTSFISSFQNYMLQNVLATDGDWHVKFLDVDTDFAKNLNGSEEIKNISITHNVGYSILEGGTNDYKPYLFLSAFNFEAFKTLPVNILDGRLPQNSSEIVISLAVEENGGISFRTGDKITLKIGDRLFKNTKLNQSNPIIKDEDGNTAESFVIREEKTFTVVGICKRPYFEDYNAPGYSVLTMLDYELSKTDSINIAVKLKNMSNVYTFTETVSEGRSYSYNSDLLRFSGVSNDYNFMTVLYTLGIILIILIITGSVLLIYNSFSISVSERTNQFGILSSVGATKKQLRKSVLFEGMFIGLIGIPIGILSGIGGIGVTFLLVGGLFESMSNTGIPMRLFVSPVSVVTAGLLGIMTILISAYIPAVKASKMSAIDAIRQSNDIKINSKKVKTSKIIYKLFKLEGTLALKNFKRNKKRYRSTVISLFVSVVLFISSSAFAMYLKDGVNTSIGDIGYDIAFSYNKISDEENINLYNQFKNTSGIYKSGYNKSFNLTAEVSENFLSESFIKYYRGQPVDGMYKIDCLLHAVDDGTYTSYIKELGLDIDEYTGKNPDKMIAMSKINVYDMETGRYVLYDIFKDKKNIDLPLSSTNLGDSAFEKEVTVSYFTDKTPEIISQSYNTSLILFIPYSHMEDFFGRETSNNTLYMSFLSKNPGKSAGEIKDILANESITYGYSLFNIDEVNQANRNILLIINVFSYGFIILISLITIANVFNTVSTNINLRRREFAMLKSVGITNRGFNRMINFECIFYGLKALLYGLPTSFLITFLIYKGVMAGADVAFSLPWLSVGVSIFSVFFVVFVTMLYSISKVKKENIIDALKKDIY